MNAFPSPPALRESVALGRTVLQSVRGTTGLLTVDQALSSASNALVVLAGGWLLSAGDFDSLSIGQLTVVTLLALQRSLLLEPAMSLSESARKAEVGLVHVAGGMVVFGSALLLLWPLVAGGGHLGLRESFVLFVLCQDAMRYRALSRGRVGAVLRSDALSLATLAALILLLRPDSIGGLLWSWGISALVGILPLWQSRGGAEVAPLLATVRLGGYQTVDTVLGSATYLLPMLLVNWLTLSSGVGAFRVSQTLLGPLNSISSAVVISRLMAARQLKESRADVLIAEARRAGKKLRRVTLLYCGLALIFGLLYSWRLDAAVRVQLLYALPLTLAVAIVGSPATAYVAVLRGLAMQAPSIRPRVLVLAATLLSFLIGWFGAATLGMDPLIVPVAVTPLAGLLLWRRIAVRLISDRG